MAIPLPGDFGSAFGRGIDTGSAMFQRLMQPVLERQKMAQLAQQHQAAIEQKQTHQYAQLEQMWKKHQEEMALKKETEARRAQESQLKQQAQPLNLDLLRAQIEHQNALAEKAKRPENTTKTERANQLTKSHLWASLPSSTKEHLTALGNGLGIRPDVLVKGMTEGKSFEDVAMGHGYSKEDIENVLPKYLATSSNVTAENERKKGLAELNVFENKIAEWMGPYVRKFAGMSTKQIVDSFKGKNIDDLAKYYAALALQPEIAALRIKVMGGNMSHAGLEEIVRSNFGKSKINESQIGPEVYKKMQHYMSELLKEGSAAATGEIYGRPKGKNKKSHPYDESNDTGVKTYDPAKDEAT